MKLAILGTGVVGQTLAAKLATLGHDVALGTRDPAATLARDQPDGFGNPPMSAWAAAHPTVAVRTLADAAAHGEVVVNALAGRVSVEGVTAAGADHLAGKILIDASNPLDFSRGLPPSLTVCNTDSLAEQLQRALPKTRVVKALNTVSAPLMVDPSRLAGGDHTMFVSGDDADARRQVAGYLREWFGWRDVLELGDLSTARGTEMYLPLWIRTWMATGSPLFSVKVVRG
jgi:predicted dinucleotide-binding enzyme